MGGVKCPMRSRRRYWHWCATSSVALHGSRMRWRKRKRKPDRTGCRVRTQFESIGWPRRRSGRKPWGSVFPRARGTGDAGHKTGFSMDVSGRWGLADWFYGGSDRADPEAIGASVDKSGLGRRCDLVTVQGEQRGCVQAQLAQPPIERRAGHPECLGGTQLVAVLFPEGCDDRLAFQFFDST